MDSHRLIEYLEEFCPDLALPLAVQFPQDICLKHVIDVWKTAVERFRKARDF